VRGLRDFERYLKGQMLEYTWCCGSGWRVKRVFFELWLGIASVPACVLQVMACRLDNNDSLRLSTKDVEHGYMVVAMCDETKGWSSFNVCVLLSKLLHMFIFP